MPLPDGYRFPDVSHHRTVCDWQTFCNSYPIASCKASEGRTFRDPSFSTWLKRMRKLGTFPIAYHFLRREHSISDQVANFLDALDDRPIGICLDIETSAAETNPTIAQADSWFTEVSKRTGIPRSNMLCYMPRWWYLAHGNGDESLADTILWNSNYTIKPNLSPFAGTDVEIIQYSSSALIDGLCSPHTGDMNIAIGLTAKQFLSRLANWADKPPPLSLIDTEVPPMRLVTFDGDDRWYAVFDSGIRIWLTQGFPSIWVKAHLAAGGTAHFFGTADDPHPILWHPSLKLAYRPLRTEDADPGEIPILTNA